MKLGPVIDLNTILLHSKNWLHSTSVFFQTTANVRKMTQKVSHDRGSTLFLFAIESSFQEATNKYIKY